MAVLIPVSPGTPSISQRVILDDRLFLMRLVWNARASAWFLSLYTDEESPLILSMPLRAGTTINRHARSNPAAPTGVFVVLDSTGRGVDPTLEDLGYRVALVYLSADEVAAARAEL